MSVQNSFIVCALDLLQDSPSSKLLYAKEIPRYRQLISAFYSGVQQLPPVGDLEMSLIMADHSTVKYLCVLVLLYSCSYIALKSVVERTDMQFRGVYNRDYYSTN
jgi:Plexin cytoplasmic RasGAP domain